MELTNQQKITLMCEFTEIYKSSSNIFEREQRCVEMQLRSLMLPLREGDLLAGRKIELPIGFWPQPMRGGVGYYCNEYELIRIKKDSSLSPEQKQAADDLINFWRGKTTMEKIISQYSTDMKNKLTHGDFNKEPGIGFPLYRIGGAQMDPTMLLEMGIDGLVNIAVQKRETNPNFFNGINSVLISLQKLCLRYSDEAYAAAGKNLDRSYAGQLSALSEDLRHIAFKPAASFRQAMQLSYLFYLISGTFNYGRMDEYLGSYLTADLDLGIITEEYALTLTKNLWDLINERNLVFDSRVILGGADRKNVPAADRFAMIAMEASRQMKFVVPQLTLRCYKDMDPKLYDKAFEVIGEGITYPLLYNDGVNIPAVANAFSVDSLTAAKYVPFGCGEYVIYNKSFGTPSGAINLLHGLNTAVIEDNLLEIHKDFDSFYNAYIEKISEYIMLLAMQEKLEYDVCSADAPFLYYSLLFNDCISRGKPIFDGGIRYLGGTLESYGNTNTADSLAAIKMLVYEKKTITPAELKAALINNFKGYEDIRQKLLSTPKYGNDNDIADAVSIMLHEDICRITRECAEKTGLHSYLIVVINNSMNTTFGLNTGASADGRLSNTYMANANNPNNGSDKNGITAMLNSLTKLKVDMHAGSVQNMRFTKDMFTQKIDITKGLLSVYFKKGGSQAMITVLNRGDLENAMKEPEKYGNLVVRVGGFSARFVELSREVQKDLLSRTLY